MGLFRSQAKSAVSACSKDSMAYAIESGGTSLCRAREGLNQAFPRPGRVVSTARRRHRPWPGHRHLRKQPRATVAEGSDSVNARGAWPSPAPAPSLAGDPLSLSAGVHHRDQRQGLGRIHPTNGRVAIGGHQHPPTLRQHELARLNEVAPRIPPGTQEARLILRHPVGDRKSEAVRNIHRLLFAIDGRGDDADALFRERSTAFFISGQQPDAIGSPVAAVEEHDRQIRFQIGGQLERSAAGDVQRHVGKHIPSS